MNRRNLLLVAASTLAAGCSGSPGEPQPPPTGEPTPTPTTTPPPTSTASPTTAATPVEYDQRFRDRLADAGIETDYLAIEGDRAILDHYVDENTVEVAGAAVGDVGVEFAAVVGAGWDVSGLDGTILNREDDEMATYRIKSVWARQFDEGMIDSDTYVRKIEGTLDVVSEEFEGSTPTATPPPSKFLLGGHDVEPADAFTLLHVYHNHETRWSVDSTTLEDFYYPAAEGKKLLVVQLRIRNRGNTGLLLYPWLFDVYVDGVGRIEALNLEGEIEPLLWLGLDPGEVVEGWTVYEVDEDASEGDLVVDQSVYDGSVACDFIRNDDIEIGI